VVNRSSAASQHISAQVRDAAAANDHIRVQATDISAAASGAAAGSAAMIDRAIAQRRSGQASAALRPVPAGDRGGI